MKSSILPAALAAIMFVGLGTRGDVGAQEARGARDDAGAQAPPGTRSPGGRRAATTGTLSINDGIGIRQYTPGVSITIPVTVTGGAGGDAVPVTVTSSNDRVATAAPAACFLSAEGSSRSCQVFVRAVGAGTAILTAAAPGYTPVSIPAVVGGTPPLRYDFGSVEIGAFPSAHPPSTSNFVLTAQLGQVVTLQASLTGFNQPLNGVPILLTASAGTILGNPQCSVDSGADPNHYCLYRLQLPGAPPPGNRVVVTGRVVGEPASFQSWNAPTVTITTTSAAVNGAIVLETLDGTAPRGMSTPLWAVLQDSSGVGGTRVTLEPSGAGITINPGIDVTSGPYQTRACTLSSASPVCGFGVKGGGAGDVTIGASATGGNYAIRSLPLRVDAALAAARVFRFTNSRARPVWVGITSGTSNSYATRALISSLDSSAGGPNKMCGPSNPAGACPRGSTCQQGGANPNAGTTYFCYWDPPVPSNGYEISASATDSTSASISQSSYDPVADITWSGNFFPREDCRRSPDGRLICAIADCGNSSSGEGCAPGTGGAPAVATLPEVTLQRYSTDYYDISIISGANIATSFGPDAAAETPDSPVPPADGYACGTAGARQAQGLLPESDWDLAAHVAEPMVIGGTLPYSETAQTSTPRSTAYYHFVSTVTPRQAPHCTASSACSTPGYVCGYDANAVANGPGSDYQTSCGEQLAWLSASQVWAFNESPSNRAPFRFQGGYTTGSGTQVRFNQLFSCVAPTVSGYARPDPDPALACGCTNWGDGGLPPAAGDARFASTVAAPSAACTANNTIGAEHPWTAYVLPTIAWLKRACPTCYTYPFDDMSSTFQCTDHALSSSGMNSVPYVITFSGRLPGQ